MFTSINEYLKEGLKRAFDILLSFFGLVFLSPIFGLIALLIHRDSPGPTFFLGDRVGRDGRTFKILKFRTMYEEPKSYQGPPITCKEDDRITPLGHWLRDTKVNELPQLWNVLKGDMSLVGPRPECVEVVPTWPEDARLEILSVRPGVTSPASVLYHDEENLLSKKDVMGEYFKNIVPDKLRLDRLYVRHHSFFGDLDTIFWTAAILIPQLGRSRIPEHRIFAGPFFRLVYRHLSWFLVDLMVSLGAVIIAGLLWRSQQPLNWGLIALAWLALVLALLFSGVNAAAGMNQIVWERTTADDTLGLMFSCGFATLLLLLLNGLQNRFHWLPLPALPFTMLLFIGLTAQMGFIAVRYRWRMITFLVSRWLNWRRGSPAVGERVLVIGSGEGFQMVNWIFKRRSFRSAFSILGIVEVDDFSRLGMQIEGCPVLGGVNDLTNLIARFDVGLVLATVPGMELQIEKQLVDLCSGCQVRLVFMDDLLDTIDLQLAQPLFNIDSATQLQENLEYRRLRDSLTGLPNHLLFQERLQHAIALSKRYGIRQMVMVIELEELQAVNEELGYVLGAECLKMAAQRILESKRESDTLARLGGHEFALILEHIADEDAAIQVAKRIYESVSKPYSLNGRSVLFNPCMYFITQIDQPDGLMSYVEDGANYRLRKMDITGN